MKFIADASSRMRGRARLWWQSTAPLSRPHVSTGFGVGTGPAFRDGSVATGSSTVWMAPTNANAVSLSPSEIPSFFWPIVTTTDTSSRPVEIYPTFINLKNLDGKWQMAIEWKENIYYQAANFNCRFLSSYASSSVLAICLHLQLITTLSTTQHNQAILAKLLYWLISMSIGKKTFNCHEGHPGFESRPAWA